MSSRPIAVAVVTLAVLTAPAPAMASEDGSPSMDGETALPPPEGAHQPALVGASDGEVPSDHVVDTSNYMFGSAYVQVVFLESNGSDEPESEDWTATQAYAVPPTGLGS